jgi:hypothetical protein
MNGFASAFSLAAGLRALIEPPGYGVVTWFLALVFVWSGLAKLRRPTLAAMAMVDFGIARRVQPWRGRALGTVELLLAVALALGLSPQLVLLLTSALLWGFVTLIARSLWAGERFACFCFGDSEGHLSRWTLARTAALALLASTVAAATPPPAQAGLEPTDVLQAVTALALLGVIALGATIPRLARWTGEFGRVRAPSQTGGD